MSSANELCEWLKEHGVPAGRYHGQMNTRDREEAQQGFMRGDHRIMIATKAFGLGIDKPDIRLIIHYEFPDSLETYAQEAGRAGRDDLPARAVLLYRLEDKRIQTYFLGGRYPSVAEMSAVYEALAAGSKPGANPDVHGDSENPGASKKLALSADDLAEYTGVSKRRVQVILHLFGEEGIVRRGRGGYTLAKHGPVGEEQIANLLTTYVDRATRDKERLAEMMHYAETAACRTQVLRRYFSEPEGEPCGRCDNCERGSHAEGELAQAAELDWARRRSRRKKMPKDIAQTIASEHCSQNLTVMTSACGEIRTTAPDTLPQVSPTLKVGDRVHHKRFGLGEIRDVHGTNALVRFPGAGEKRLLLSVISRAV